MKLKDQFKALQGESEEDMFELSSEQLKAVKDWDVGEEYTVVLKLKQVSKELEDDGTICGEFEILSVKQQ
jgi:hypothetical protein